MDKVQIPFGYYNPCLLFLLASTIFAFEHVRWQVELQNSCIHCYENPIYVFLFWELRGLSPSFHIHVSVSDLYVPRIGPHIWLLQNRQTDPGNTNINLLQIFECRNWKTEHYNSVLEIGRLHSFIAGNAGNQTFMLDSHRPFVCSIELIKHS